MNLFSFALKNLKGNVQSFKTYFLANAFSVMIFFVFAMLIYHPEMQDLDGVQKGLKQGTVAVEYIIFGFLMFFVSYSITSFLKQRSKDYAIVKIVGASPKQLFLVHFYENLIVFIGSILAGILLGVVLSKFFFMIISRMIEMETFEVYFAKEAFVLTIVVFFLLFLVLNAISSIALLKINLVKILQFSRTAQKPQKIRPFFAVLGLLLMFSGYYLGYTAVKTNILSRFLPALALVIVGTYLFYSQSIVYLLFHIKKSRWFYYKGINLLWISDLSYRVKSLSWVMFFSTIVIASGLTAFSSIYSLAYSQEKKLAKDNYYSLIMSYSNEGGKALFEKSKKVLDDHKVDYEHVALNTLVHKFEGNNFVFFAKLSDFKGQGFSSVSNAKIADDEVLMLQPAAENRRTAFRNSTLNKQIEVEGVQLRVTDTVTDILATRIAFKVFALVSDAKFKELASKLTPTSVHLYKYDNVTVAGNELMDLTMKHYSSPSNVQPNFFIAIGAQYYYFLVSKRYSLFLSFLVGAIFFISAASMLYFNFFNHLQVEKKKYQNIVKIGLSEKEIIQSSRIQMGILFFLPNLFAISHTFIAIKALSNAMESTFIEPVLIVFSVMVLIQIVYFISINHQYNRHLKKAIRLEA